MGQLFGLVETVFLLLFNSPTHSVPVKAQAMPQGMGSAAVKVNSAKHECHGASSVCSCRCQTGPQIPCKCSCCISTFLIFAERSVTAVSIMMQ